MCPPFQKSRSAPAKENETLEIIYDSAKIFTGSTNLDLLTILGAAYGPSDVTQTTQSLFKDNTLQTEVDNSIFGPHPWYGVKISGSGVSVQS